MEKTPEKAVATIPHNVPADTSVEAFIAQAIEAKLPVETMERFFALRNEVMAQRAKEMFNVAMSNFQADCPTIEKTKEVRTKSGARAYSYAPIESIVKQVQHLLKREQLSYSFKIEITEKTVKAICVVKHIAGHTETSEMEVPLGNKTDIMSNSQVTAAASTFAKRYAFCNAFGIMTGDEDTDGAGTDGEAPQQKKPSKISPKAKIVHLLGKLGIAKTANMAAEIKRLTQIEVSDDPAILEEVVNRLEILVKEKK